MQSGGSFAVRNSIASVGHGGQRFGDWGCEPNCVINKVVLLADHGCGRSWLLGVSQSVPEFVKPMVTVRVSQDFRPSFTLGTRYGDRFKRAAGADRFGEKR